MLPTEYNDDLVQDFEIESQPTRTYALRFDGYPCSGGKLDGLEAMKQAIFLILQTERLEVTRQIFELDPDKSLQRELLLLKVACDAGNRAALREISSIYKAKIIDLSPDSMIFELTGKPDKIDAFLAMLRDYDILELCRTGVTALERGGKHQHMQKPAQEVREAQLPLPGTHCH